MQTRRPPAAQALFEARTLKGLSQFHLAVRAELSLQTVSLAERTGHFTDRTAERLAAALDVPVGSLR
jgi:transcriptional regulator with XRE-family HTH domain